MKQFEGVRLPVAVLKFLGTLSLAALVIVVPVAMRWWGGLGFLLSLLGVLMLSWAVTGLSFYLSRSLGFTTGQRLMFALPRLNPFAAPAAGESLLERALAGAEPLAVARLLMEEAEFAHWIRPLAYDAVLGIEVERGNELVKVLGREQVELIVTTRPARVEALGKWCPRCGAEFGEAPSSCPSCEVALTIGLG